MFKSMLNKIKTRVKEHPTYYPVFWGSLILSSVGWRYVIESHAKITAWVGCFVSALIMLWVIDACYGLKKNWTIRFKDKTLSITGQKE